MKPPRYRLPSLTRSPGDPAAGRAKQRSGADFQAQINQSNDWYRAKKLAIITDIPTATVHRRGQLQYSGKRGKVDYIGLVRDHPDGDAIAYPVAFDAKVTSGRTLSLAHWDDPRHRDRVARQVDFLLAHAEMGGLGGYLCLDRSLGVVFLLPPYVLAPLASPQALAGWTPEIVVRDLNPKNFKGPRFHSPHPYVPLSSDADVVSGRAPRIRWRDVMLMTAPNPPSSPTLGDMLGVE